MNHGHKNWNDDIISAVRTDLAPRWTDFDQQARQRIYETVRSITHMLHTGKDALIGKEKLGVQKFPAPPLT